MAADAILNYAKACKVPVRDSLDLDSRHIKLPFHKFSAIHIFFPFDNLKKSNDLGLLCNNLLSNKIEFGENQ